jgi:hypothetical protein
LPAPRSGFYIANAFTSAHREMGSRVLRSGTTVFDLSAKQQLHNGFGNSSSAAVELVVSPLLMGLLGWVIDGWLDIRPVLTVALFAFTLGYVAWKHYALYQHSMADQERTLLGPKTERADS